MVKRKATSRTVLFSAAALALSAGLSAWWGSRASAAPGAPAAPAAPVAPAAQSTGSVGAFRLAVANPAHIFNDMAETKAMQAELAEEAKKFNATDHEKRAAIEDMKQKRDNLNPDHPQWAELNGQLANLAAEYKVWIEVQRARIDMNRKQKMKVLYKKIEDAVGEVALREHIDLVMTDNRDPLPTNLDEIDVLAFRSMILSRGVLFASDRADISQAVVTVLDAKYRAGGGVIATPAPAAPANPAGSGILPGASAGRYVPRP